MYIYERALQDLCTGISTKGNLEGGNIYIIHTHIYALNYKVTFFQRIYYTHYIIRRSPNNTEVIKEDILTNIS